MKLGIIGIGLIGGSIAKELKSNDLVSKVYGFDINKEHCKIAIKNELVDEIVDLVDLCKKSDLIIIAIPVNQAKNILLRVLDNINESQIVTDVGSTKTNICNVAENHPLGNRFVPGHPIAGTENSGPESAQLELFKDKKGILCPLENTDSEALETVWEMYNELGMSIVMMDYNDHDKHIAYVSHLSHISSFALGLTVLDIEKNENNIFNMAGSGFASTVRLAKSSAEMWKPIFQENYEFLLPALSEYIEQLNNFKTLLLENKSDEIYELMQRANDIRRILEGK